MQLLLSYHAAVDIQSLDLSNGTGDGEGDGCAGTPLWFASKYGHTRVVELLLDNNACIESVPTKSGMSPLCIASFSGHIETTKLLLSRGANVDFTIVLEDGVNWRPLIWAVGKGDIEMVDLLVSFGACVQGVESNCNPLVLALSFEHTEIRA